MWNDFKAFIARGNMLDLAIGIVLGAAFSTIVKTLTDGIIMPFVSLLTGGIDFKQKVLNLGDMPINTPEQIAAAEAAKQPLLYYGQFISDIITFLIVAVVMFLLARYAVRMFRGLEAETPPTDETVLLTEIRDILKAR
jgi:large conductance mechanosensitive channel